MNNSPTAATAFDDLVSVREAAALLHVSESTVWRWINAGDVPSYRVGRKRVYVKRQDVAPKRRPASGPSEAERRRLNLIPMSSPEPGVDPVALARALHERQRVIPGWTTGREAWEDINEARDERSQTSSDLC